MEISNKESVNCLDMLSDPVEAKARMSYAVRAVTRLRRYRDTVNRLERCAGTEKHLGDRAHAAENDTRVLLKCALDSLNEMRDSRTFEEMATVGAKLTGKGSSFDYSKSIKGAKEFLAEHFSKEDLEFLDECNETLKQHALDVRFAGVNIHTTLQHPGGKKSSIAFPTKLQPGHLGRISSTDFFGKYGTVITIPDPAFADDDCHHRLQVAQPGLVELVDPYSNLVGAFAYTRDSMARHTKVAQHFGRPHLRANPVAVIIAIAVVAAVLIIAGATLLIGCAAGAWSGSACDWGWGLLIAGAAIGVGLACYVGGCEIIIQGISLGVIGG